MTRSPDSLVPSASGQPDPEKRDDKALTCWQEGEAKPATDRNTARMEPVRRDGVEGGGTQRQRIDTTGETRFGPAEAAPSGREAYKGETRKRSNDAAPGVGGGRSVR